MSGNSVKSGLSCIFPVPSFPRMAQGTDFYLVVTLELFEVAGSGGRDRTADLGVMNAASSNAPIHSSL